MINFENHDDNLDSKSLSLCNCDEGKKKLQFVRMKRIKTKPDGLGQMDLTDLYPWAEEKASPSLI